VKKLPWKDKLARSVGEHLGQEACSSILAGGEGIGTTSGPGTKSRWIKTVMERLDGLAGADTRRKVMEASSCPYSKVRIAGAKKLYRQCQSMEEFLEKAAQAGLLADKEVALKDDVIYLTKFHYHRNADAVPAEDFVMHACHCGWAKGTREEISATFCMCGAGFYRQFFEEVLEREVRIEVVKSVLRGDRECVMAVFL
jgi:predicted hydrocarbon binding protein